MPFTIGQPAKKALITLLRAQAEPGSGGAFDLLAVAHEWPQVTVKYGWLGEMGGVCIYGGGWKYVQEEAAQEGPGVVVQEAVDQTIYVRVQSRTQRDLEVVDEWAQAINNAIGGVLLANPKLGGNLSALGNSGGFGDYEPGTDDETVVVHTHTVRIGALFGWAAP